MAAAQAAAPSYSATSIVNAGNYTPGPFAPNSILSIFGTELARGRHELTAADMRGGMLPTELNYTQVLVDGSPAALFYVDTGQVNFLISSKQSTGPVRVQVVREGWAGPAVNITVVDSAPALFARPDGYAIATHVDNSLVAPDSPAHRGEIVVLYLTGLGKTDPNPDIGEVPKYGATIIHLGQLEVRLDGAVVDAGRIKYAGLTPGSAGLYQINLELPDRVGNDPEIRVSVLDQTSPEGLKLAVR